MIKKTNCKNLSLRLPASCFCTFYLLIAFNVRNVTTDTGSTCRVLSEEGK